MAAPEAYSYKPDRNEPYIDSVEITTLLSMVEDRSCGEGSSYVAERTEPNELKSVEMPPPVRYRRRHTAIHLKEEISLLFGA